MWTFSQSTSALRDRRAARRYIWDRADYALEVVG
jgi:hypothetical protein